MPVSVTRVLSEFASEFATADVPDAVLHDARRLVLDAIACGLGGYDAGPSSRIVLDVVGGAGGTPEATILVGGRRVPMPVAAYVNTHFGNVLDADDTLRYRGHHGIVSVFPALAVGEREGSPGRDFLAAVAVA